MTWSKVLKHFNIVSRKEAQRLLESKAVEVNGEIIQDVIPSEGLYNVKIGKHRFFSLLLNKGEWQNVSGNPGMIHMRKSPTGWEYLGRTNA